MIRGRYFNLGPMKNSKTGESAVVYVCHFCGNQLAALGLNEERDVAVCQCYAAQHLAAEEDLRKPLRCYGLMSPTDVTD